MDSKYKTIITTLKENIDNNILDYLKNNFTRITNCDVGEQYEKDFNLLILCKQKTLKTFKNKTKDIIVDLYQYDIAPNGYFIVYNQFNNNGNQVECDIFI